MTQKPPSRNVAAAMMRGLRGRCPACGKGKILSGYLRPVSECARCGENLGPYQTADFAPYVVTFLVGLIYTPLVLVLTLQRGQNDFTIIVVLAAALLTALVMLPRAKGAFLGLLWALDIHNT